MRLWNRKGKLLRLRPGPLANFSGGAGYMPLLWVFNAPVSIAFGLVAYIILGRKARTVGKLSAIDVDPEAKQTALFEFVAYGQRFFKVCLATAAVVALLFILMGQNMIYTKDTWPYTPTLLILALGPFAAWLLATRFLIGRVEKGRILWQSILIAAAVHILLIVVSVVLGYLVLFAWEP